MLRQAGSQPATPCSTARLARARRSCHTAPQPRPGRVLKRKANAMHELDEARFNADLRKLLKTFGVTAQREVEKAVWKAAESGALSKSTVLRARAHLEVDGVDLELLIEDEIHLG